MWLAMAAEAKLPADRPPDKKMWVDAMPQQENNTKKMYVILRQEYK
jgi:hypothetical protein